MNEKMKLILGTMTFGSQVSLDDSRDMVQFFLESGHNEIDTAYVYNDGDTERILGSIFSEISSENLSIATKVHPRITGRLDGDAVNMQLTESLQRLSKDSVDILYLHFPDSVTPIENALETCANLYIQGVFKELGLSNFPAWMVVDIWHKCKENGWPKPSIYQGMYNGLSRKAEIELFPALRQLDMRFYAFNPLAGGILSGKYQNYNTKPSPGRFTVKPHYRDRYWKESFFEAIDFLSNMCEDNEIRLAEAAYRWLAFHSSLEQKRGDGIIIGASRMSQLKQNIMALEKGPLPESIVDAFNQAWEEAKAESPEYFRFYTP